MKIRVAITGRNHAPWVEKNLASVLSQDVGPHELVIDWTDDASDDSEAEMIALRMLPDMGVEMSAGGRRNGILRRHVHEFRLSTGTGNCASHFVPNVCQDGGP